MTTNHTELCERLRTENSCDEGFYEHCTEAADLIESQAARIAELEKERDAEDAKRYRFIRSKMQVGAVQTQLPLYRTLHWIGYEDCSDVRNADAAIDAEIERSETK